MYQVQGAGERVVAMVMKELPGRKASESVTSQLVREQQENRPLLSPSIDDFLSVSRNDAPPSSNQPIHNTAVLSTALDLVDLSEPGSHSHSHASSSSSSSSTNHSTAAASQSHHHHGNSGSSSGTNNGTHHGTNNGTGSHRASSISNISNISISNISTKEASNKKSPLRRRAARSCRSPRRRHADETELIQVEVESFHNKSPNKSPSKTPERVSLDSVSLCSPLDKWDDVNFETEDGRKRHEKKCTSHHSSSELLWSAEFKNDPKNSFDIHSFDELDFNSTQDSGASSRRRRRTRSLLGRKESLEDEFVRAKAAVESDTEFWDKMQAEWEELARRNWLEETEGQAIQPTVNPTEKGYYFNSTNPYKEWPNAFVEGQEKAREGDLNNAVLLLEAAILQDPQDSEAWQVLGMTQAENENEQAAIVSLQRCLELRPNNLAALMSLAVSFTNCGMRSEACDALNSWISHNDQYKHLAKELQGSPATPRRGSHTHTPVSSVLQDVQLLFQEAVISNADSVDPDLQTGLGVLFNLSSDFNRAVEAFTAALSVRPQDYLLWNRLGATLANGTRSEEAVEAYSRALELQPGFIRCRYNLGISCLHLGAHREAVSNFLLALNQQRQTESSSQQQNMSANIWTALRIAVSLMERPELTVAANTGDLDLLMAQFNLSDA